MTRAAFYLLIHTLCSRHTYLALHPRLLLALNIVPYQALTGLCSLCLHPFLFLRSEFVEELSTPLALLIQAIHRRDRSHLTVVQVSDQPPRLLGET